MLEWAVCVCVYVCVGGQYDSQRRRSTGPAGATEES